jgi:GMP reductase
VREEFPNKTIMAGNVVTGEMVEELILSGADIIKVRKSLGDTYFMPCF